MAQMAECGKISPNLITLLVRFLSGDVDSVVFIGEAA